PRKFSPTAASSVSDQAAWPPPTSATPAGPSTTSELAFGPCTSSRRSDQRVVFGAALCARSVRGSSGSAAQIVASFSSNARRSTVVALPRALTSRLPFRQLERQQL